MGTAAHMASFGVCAGAGVFVGAGLAALAGEASAISTGVIAASAGTALTGAAFDGDVVIDPGKNIKPVSGMAGLFTGIAAASLVILNDLPEENAQVVPVAPVPGQTISIKGNCTPLIPHFVDGAYGKTVEVILPEGCTVKQAAAPIQAP